MAVRSIKKESLVKKLAISFFFMSIVPILLLLYIFKVLGDEILLSKLPYLRLTIALTVCLVFVMFVFLRFSLRSITHIMNIAKGIAGGDYTKRIEVNDGGEAGQLASSFNKITGELEAKIKQLEESKGIIQDIFKKVAGESS